MQEENRTAPKKKHLGLTIYLALSAGLILVTSILPFLFVSLVPLGGWFMFFLWPVFIFGGVVAVLNYLVIPPLLVVKKPDKDLVFAGLIVLVISLPVAYYGVEMAKSVSDADKLTRQYEAEDARADREYKQGRAAMSEVDIEKATSLLKDCEIVGFYTPDQVAPHNAVSVESSGTGILLRYVSEDDRFRMYVADRMVGTMLPIAKDAQSGCTGLEIGRDGVYPEDE